MSNRKINSYCRKLYWQLFYKWGSFKKAQKTPLFWGNICKETLWGNILRKWISHPCLALSRRSCLFWEPVCRHGAMGYYFWCKTTPECFCESCVCFHLSGWHCLVTDTVSDCISQPALGCGSNDCHSDWWDSLWHTITLCPPCEIWDGLGGQRKKEKSPKNFIAKNLKKLVPVLPFKTKIDWKSFVVSGAKIVRLKLSLQSAVQMNIFLEENHENCRMKLKEWFM